VLVLHGLEVLLTQVLHLSTSTIQLQRRGTQLRQCLTILAGRILVSMHVPMRSLSQHTVSRSVSAVTKVSVAHKNGKGLQIFVPIQSFVRMRRQHSKMGVCSGRTPMKLLCCLH
jgi:hypothetical protein